MSLLQAIRSAPSDAPALDDGVRRVSYGSLAGLVGQEMSWLRAAGGERHALLAGNGVPWAVADLALHESGLLSVPLPGSFTPAQLRHALDDAGIDTLLVDDAAAPAIRPLAGWSVTGTAPGSGLHRLQRSLRPQQQPVVPAGTAKITYTSGSTSTPRGVCLSAASLEAVATSLAGATRELPIVRHLVVLPLATLLENVGGLYAPLLRGALCLLPSCESTGMSYGAFDVRRFVAAVGQSAPHSLILVPELLQALVAAAAAGWRVPAALQFVAVGGARVSPALLERAVAAGIPAYEGYGLSECGSVVCLNRPRASRPGTVGRPLPHLRVRVDERGEVRVSGPTMLGYLGAAPRAAQAELATGDLGQFDADGYLTLNGRLGNCFITAFGRNVSPEWVESELSQRLGGQPVLAHGEARPYVVALLGGGLPGPDDAAVERAVRAANAQLPDYAQVRRWARAPQPFSPTDGTLTANGRLRRAAVLERDAACIEALYRDAACAV